MPLTKTQKAPSVAAQHGPSMARDALFKAFAPIASGSLASNRQLFSGGHGIFYPAIKLSLVGFDPAINMSVDISF